MPRIDHAEHFDCEDCDTKCPCEDHEAAATAWHESQKPDKDR